MRLNLTKEIVRNATAYKVARSITDGLLLAELVVALLAVLVVVIYDSRQGTHDIPTVVGVVVGSFLFAVASILQREFLQAIFDIADCALLERKTPGAGDNPFAV